MKRASKTTYITDIGGNVVIPFQFAPHELTGAEGANFSERVRVGGHEPELIWISGEVRRISVPFFIDRTMEAYSKQRFNYKPLDPLRRFPSTYPRLTQSDAEALRVGTANANGGQPKETPEFVQTDFDPNPDFRMFQNDNNVGVYRDLELFLYFIRPSGMGLEKAKFDTQGTFTLLGGSESRFVPPPVCRFFYGNYWIQGYLARIEYKVSALNELLVPRRLEGTLNFLIEKDGLLVDL